MGAGAVWNGAYSAPRGYDMRTPYNVPMGEIKVLRVVEPFSISSYQNSSIVGALPPTCRCSGQLPPCRPRHPRQNPAAAYYNVDVQFHKCECDGHRNKVTTVGNQYPPFSNYVVDYVFVKNGKC